MREAKLLEQVAQGAAARSAAEALHIRTSAIQVRLQKTHTRSKRQAHTRSNECPHLEHMHLSTRVLGHLQPYAASPVRAIFVTIVSTDFLIPVSSQHSIYVPTPMELDCTVRGVLSGCSALLGNDVDRRL